MHLGRERTAAFIRQVLDAGSYVVCHQTLTYGDFPDYGPAICRGFFDSYYDRSRDLLILQAGRRLTEVPPPLVAKAAELGRNAGKAAASSTPEEEYQRVLRGIEEGDPAVLGATKPPRSAPEPGTARMTSPATSASSPPTAPCPGPCPPTSAPSPAPSGRKPSGPPATTPVRTRRGLITRPGEKQCSAKRGAAREKNTAIRRCGGEINLARCFREVPAKVFP
jgi:hypothetical protein